MWSCHALRLNSWTHHASIFTSLVRPDAPALIKTSALRHLKCSATNATSSAFALPSTGAAFTLACHVPSAACTSDAARALGLTLTRRVIVATGLRPNG